MNIVTIGSGAAAITAVETIRGSDKNAEITVISHEREIYSPCLLPYYVSGDINEEHLLFRGPDFYDRLKVNPVFKKATEVVPAQSLVMLDDGSKVHYDQLLIATGSSPRLPRINGMDKNGVFFFNTAEDARKVAKWAEGAARALVIGAGYIGIEAAISLRKKRIAVTIIEIQDRVLPELLDKETAEVARKQLERNGIEVILEGQVSELTGNGKVTGAIWGQQVIESDMVIVAAGVSPNIDPVKGARINLDAGIMVDGYMMTSIKNIYAAGDVARATDIVTGVKRVNAIWPNAIRQGRIAAYNMLGISTEYEGSDRMNVIDIFGLVIVTFGHMALGSEKIGPLSKRIALEDDRIVGLTFIGNVKTAGVILSLIRKGVNISGIRDITLKDEFGYGKIARYISAAFPVGTR